MEFGDQLGCPACTRNDPETVWTARAALLQIDTLVDESHYDQRSPGRRDLDEQLVVTHRSNDLLVAVESLFAEHLARADAGQARELIEQEVDRALAGGQWLFSSPGAPAPARDRSSGGRW